MTNIPVQERIKWIGASEVAGLVGASPWTSRFQLWHEKAGSVPRADRDDDERIMAGRHLEPAIATWANQKWGWDLANVPDYIPHPAVPGFGCSLDFRAAGSGEPVEIKNVDGLIFRQKWETEGDDLIDAPAEYLIQVQAQMACTGAASAWIVACVGGNKLYRMRVERHDGLIAKLEKEVVAFWRSIEAGEAPPADFATDVGVLAALYTKSTGPVLDLSDSNVFPAACAGYLTESATMKAAEARRDVWKAEILSLVGGASGAVGKGFSVKFIDIKESVVAASTRKAYRRMTVKEEV